MPKKPRMPKNVPPEKPTQHTPEEDAADDAVIIDAPASVTKITSERGTTKQSGKRERTAEPAADEEVQPAPRSKMRERLLASSKTTKTQSKRRKAKRIDDDIWDRADRAASFDDDPEPARQFSGRAVALLAVLFIAALIMAQPLQLLLEQQADITHAQQQLKHETDRQQELETELKRWEDPAFVQQQARERFNMVMPGERKYLVLDDEQEDRLAESEPGVAPLDEDVEMGWADRLWGSVLSSGQE